MPLVSLERYPHRPQPETESPMRRRDRAANPFVLLAQWQSFLDVSGRCNARTRRQYRNRLLDFWGVLADPEWEGNRNPLEIDDVDVVEHIRQIHAQGSMRSESAKALRSFYGWVWERVGMSADPTGHLESRRAKYDRAPSLTPEETERVLWAGERVDPRTRWAMQLQYATGCRAGSLLGLEVRDCFEEAGGPMLHFRVAKGDKPYRIAIEGPAVEAFGHLRELIGYAPERVTRRPTLVGVGYHQYESWCKRAALVAGPLGEPMTSHLLRHTAITRWCEAGVDVRTIMELANWEDASLIRRYATPSAPNMRAAGAMLLPTRLPPGIPTMAVEMP